MNVTPIKTGYSVFNDTTYSGEIVQSGTLNLDIDPLLADSGAFYVVELLADGSDIVLDSNFDSCNLPTTDGILSLSSGKYLLVVAQKENAASLIVNEVYTVEQTTPPPPPSGEENTTHITFNKVIKSQVEFDSLIIERNDKILLDGEFTGNINVDQKNVMICGGSITGGQDISSLNWTDLGNSLYSATMAINPKWINIDGKNAKLAETQWLTLTSIQGANQITVNTNDVSNSDIGNYIVFQHSTWAYSGCYTITNYDSGVVTLDRDLEPRIEGGDSYKMFNNENFIVGDKEWIWRNNEIKIKSNVSPSELDITMSAYDFGINVLSENCKIKGTEIKESYIAGIKTIYDETKVDSCRIHDIRGQGIKAPHKIGNPNFSNNTIFNIGNNGIWCGPITNPTTNNNLVYNVGMGKNIGWNIEVNATGESQTDGAGIKYHVDLENTTHDASNITADDNIIYNTAYNGLSLHLGYTGSVQRNQTGKFCNLLKDGAGLYFFHYRKHNVPMTSMVIQYNFAEVDTTGEVYGIYMDNRCIDNDLSHNTVINKTGDGSMMINADTQANRVQANILKTLNKRALWYRDWDAPNKLYNNDLNVSNGNVLIGNTPLEFSESVNPYVGGISEGNKYISNNENILLDGVFKTLLQLQTEFGVDLTSAAYINENVIIISNTSDVVLNGAPPSGNWYDLQENLISSYAVDPWKSLVLVRDLI